MRWLLHGALTSAVADALSRHGHTSQSVSDVGLSSEASPAEVFKAAHQKQLDVVTADDTLVSAVYETPVKFDRSLVFLQLEGGAVEQDDAIDRLFERYNRLSPGRLYTVTATRVKIRQLPSK